MSSWAEAASSSWDFQLHQTLKLFLLGFLFMSEVNWILLFFRRDALVFGCILGRFSLWKILIPRFLAGLWLMMLRGSLNWWVHLDIQGDLIMMAPTNIATSVGVSASSSWSFDYGLWLRNQSLLGRLLLTSLCSVILMLQKVRVVISYIWVLNRSNILAAFALLTSIYW